MAKNMISNNSDLGLLIIRLGLGLTFLLGHGLPKIMGGPDKWTHLGESMSVLGITFAPVFWGFCAGLAEALGGLLLLLGVLFRPATVCILFVMVIAVLSGLKQGTQFYNWAWPAEIAIVMIALFISGPGKYILKAK